MKIIQAIIFLSSLCLLGCASHAPLDRETSFSAGSPQGLIVFGVDIQGVYKRPRFVFAEYDETKKTIKQNKMYAVKQSQEHLTDGQKISSYMFGGTKGMGGYNYFVLSMPAGKWVLHCISGMMNGAGINQRTCFNQKSILFEVAAGESRYIGEYHLDQYMRGDLYRAPFKFTALKPDLAGAKAYLQQYKNVNTELVQLLPRRIAYEL